MKLPPFQSAIIAGLLAVIGVAVWIITDNTPPVASAPQTAWPTTAHSEPDVFPPNVAVAMPAPEPPPDLPPPKPPVVISPEALRDMDNVQFMLRDYRARLGGNPEGTNAEIMKEIMGKNRVNAKFGPPEGQEVNERGELLDRWGSPYFFHQLSMNEMELRSSGPDKAMWTSDDITVK